MSTGRQGSNHHPPPPSPTADGGVTVAVVVAGSARGTAELLGVEVSGAPPSEERPSGSRCPISLAHLSPADGEPPPHPPTAR